MNRDLRTFMGLDMGELFANYFEYWRYSNSYPKFEKLRCVRNSRNTSFHTECYCGRKLECFGPTHGGCTYF